MNPKCPYCKETMTRGDGSFWCMNKKCAEQFYPSGNDDLKTFSERKRHMVPDLVRALESEALQILSASEMSEVEIGERILEIRGVRKIISQAISKKQREGK